MMCVLVLLVMMCRPFSILHFLRTQSPVRALPPLRILTLRAPRPLLADESMPASQALLLSLLCAGAAGQAVLTASDLDSSASAVAGALESYTVGSDPSFWSNSATYSADFQTVVVGTKLTFHYSSQHDVTVAASANDWTQCAVQNGDVVASERTRTEVNHARTQTIHAPTV